VTGILVHTRDPEAYAEAVRRLCADWAMRHRIIGEAKKVVQEMFSMDRVVREHEALYRCLL
jgi:glycosyltransferase involved in cell wall biosynthesis